MRGEVRLPQERSWDGTGTSCVKTQGEAVGTPNSMGWSSPSCRATASDVSGRTFLVATVLLTGALSGFVVGRASVLPQPVSSPTGRGLPTDLRAAIRWDRHNCPAPAHPDANTC
jgi:hypothetical protein